ncbi:MAG: HEPN-associated N-terminal domain-containing protein [Pseudomonadota bacterium]|nr:HEPN-associated N-terminal domain-containing protein [Pseudomonadota bacterium]
MSEFDIRNSPDYSINNPVCAKCFEDEDIVDFIEDYDGPPGCSYCECNDAPTVPLEDVAEHMRGCLLQFYSFAADHLPYESREGGYQGAHWDTAELLFEELGFSLPQDKEDKLFFDLTSHIGDEVWCDYDWLSLDYDDALDYSWKKFCNTIQHERRFFFALANKNNQDDDYDHDEYPPLVLLHEIVKLAEEHNLVTALSTGKEIFRCRPCNPGAPYHTAHELGPPPAEEAVQANRMNPPGIPMMYGAETEEIAIRETRSPNVTVARFRLEKETRILNLAELPPLPGIFSGAERRERLGLIFIHAFSREITRPVDRTDRIHIDYIPSQVITEFIRDTKIFGSHIDGICYPSSLDDDTRNIVLFATQDDLMEADGTPVHTPIFPPHTPWVRLIGSHLAELDVATITNTE